MCHTCPQSYNEFFLFQMESIWMIFDLDMNLSSFPLSFLFYNFSWFLQYFILNIYRMLSFNSSELVSHGVKWVDVYFFVFLNCYICWYRAYIYEPKLKWTITPGILFSLCLPKCNMIILESLLDIWCNV